MCLENDRKARELGLLTSGEVVAARQYLGLTVLQLAEELNCSVQDLEEIEAGNALIDSTYDRFLRQFVPSST